MMIQKIAPNQLKLGYVFAQGMGSYGIKQLCWCQKSYGFTSRLKSESYFDEMVQKAMQNTPALFKSTEIWTDDSLIVA